MTASRHETEITADPTVPLIRIVREFDAPPAKAFRAHTDPELLVQWLGPRGLETKIDYHDCRTGGSYRYLHCSDGNGRTRLVATSLVDSFEGRDAFMASSMNEGVVQSYERLDDLLAG